MPVWATTSTSSFSKPLKVYNDNHQNFDIFPQHAAFSLAHFTFCWKQSSKSSIFFGSVERQWNQLTLVWRSSFVDSATAEASQILPLPEVRKLILDVKDSMVCLLGQWLNFKLFGITYLVGKIKFKLFFSGSIGWVSLSKGGLWKWRLIQRAIRSIRCQ